MLSLAGAFVRLFLFATFFKMLARQLYIKLMKCTRRSSGPKSLMRKLAAGYGFIKDMWMYDRHIIRRCRICLERLVTDNEREVFAYGERDVRDVLSEWTLELPIKVKVIRDYWENEEERLRNFVSLKIGAASRDKIVIASLVNVAERTRQLKELGVDQGRIILLDESDASSSEFLCD